MKPVIEKVLSPIDYSFSTEYIEVPNFTSKWHYHDKAEIILILDTSGTAVVGESITPYSGDTVCLVGSRIPHSWLNDHRYYNKESSLVAKAVVLKFDEDFVGERFLSLPGMKRVKDLLQIHSKRGLFIEGREKYELKKQILKIVETKSDFERIMLLVQILQRIAEAKNVTYPSSEQYLAPQMPTKNERLDKVINYVVENYHNTIELKTVADLSNLSQAGFCKYFKKTTLKTFTRFMNEYRIGHACRMIIDEQYSISEICYMTGFNQLSNFYKQFQAIHNMSPLQYRERFFENEKNLV